ELPLEVPLLLFVGTDIRHKGLRDLLEAQDIIRQAYPTSKLIVIGADMEEIYTLDEPLAKKAASWLITAGIRPPAEIPIWMNACDLFVLPSKSEGLGCVFLEAAACCRPAVGTRVPGVQEAIQDKVTGLLVDKGDIHGLARTIIELLDNPERRVQMGQAGHRRVTTQFQWVHNAQRTIKLYHELVS
ncbi:glycosyltransferase, partial [Chloroflexota bacterium]